MSNLNGDIQTPGPWQIEADPENQGKHPYHDNRFITAVDEDGRHVTICKMMDGVHQKPDAALIANAPSMRSDLEDGIAAAQNVVSSWEKGDLAGAVNNLREWMCQASETLAQIDKDSLWTSS